MLPLWTFLLLVAKWFKFTSIELGGRKYNAPMKHGQKINYLVKFEWSKRVINLYNEDTLQGGILKLSIL